MAGATRIAELANIIATQTKVVDDYLQSHNFSTPSFDSDGPKTLPIPASETEITRARYQVITCTEELNELMKGPTEVLWTRFHSSMADLLEIHFVQRFGIAKILPKDGSMSYDDLAKVTGLDRIDIERVLKRATLSHLFQERNGEIMHTIASRVLKEDQSVADIAELFTEEAWPCFAKTVEALDRFKGRQHIPQETGFSLANNTPMGMYDFLLENPVRMERFAKAMSGFAANEDFSLLLTGFDWTKVSTVDFEDVVAEGRLKVPTDVQDRIIFEAHDMFKTQKATGADVFLFRAIFHNWSDIRCIEILRAHIGALKAGAHILINDVVSLAPEVTPPWADKKTRTMDLTMLAFFGSRERTSMDWIDLIKEASPRFQINIIGPPSHLIKITWI
uniref:O-methyltransferase C-terminal domain-containing protein n=2 Tax=Bionectria ochroleuca TaxID=29856 RepID=A0A8H7N200_BIOOC